MITMLGFGASVPLDDKLVIQLFDEQFTPLARAVRLLVDDVNEAEEIVQEAFARLLTSRRRMRQIDDAPAYLRTTAFNLARSALRKRGTERTKQAIVQSTSDVAMDEAGALAQPDRAVVANDESNRITEALQTLPQRQRECLVMRFYLSLSEREIAEALNISAGSVKTHTSRGIDALGKRLGSEVQ